MNLLLDNKINNKRNIRTRINLKIRKCWFLMWVYWKYEH